LDFAMTTPFHLLTEFTSNQNPDRNTSNLALAVFTYEINKHLILATS
jgi:hypothetical protein